MQGRTHTRTQANNRKFDSKTLQFSATGSGQTANCTECDAKGMKQNAMEASFTLDASRVASLRAASEACTGTQHS